MTSRLAKFQRAAESDICTTEDLYHKFRLQFFSDSKGQQDSLKLNWSQNAFWDEPNDWNFDLRVERWVCSQMVRAEGLPVILPGLMNLSSPYWNHPTIQYHHYHSIYYQS